MPINPAHGRPVYQGRHVTIQFELDRAGIARCAVGRDLAEAVMQVVNRRARPYAIAISPRSDRDEDDDARPHYQDSFDTELVLTGVSPEAIGKPPMLRVGGRLVNKAPHAAAVEWGRRGFRGHRVLGKTLDHLHGISRRR